MDANVPPQQRFSADVLAFVFYALALDIAIETFWSGSSVRWWVVAVVVVYLAVCGLARWQTEGVPGRFRPVAGSTASLFVVLGLLAGTAWLPGGLTDGVRALRQPTPIVMSAVTGIAIAMAGVTLIRSAFVPSAGKWLVGALTVYSVVGCLAGIISRTPYPALFQGESFWRRLPFWLQGAVVGGLLVVPLGLAAQLLAAVMRVPARWRFQQIVALTMTLVIVASGIPHSARNPPHSARNPLPGVQPRQAAMPDQKSLSTEIEKIRTADAPQNVLATLDSMEQLNIETLRPRFDVSAKARELGPDVNKIFSFVRDRVKDEVYEGVLRADRGALMAMAGNAFDKSLLLGSLLRKNGFEVRFVRGRLGRERADNVVAQMFESARDPRESDPADVSQQLERLPAQLKTAAASLAKVTEARWRTNLDLVEGTLKRAGLHVGGTPAVSRQTLVEEATSHLWVEYRAGDQWIPLDASFSWAKSGETFTSGAQTFAEIPRDLSHRVTIRVRVEERESDKVVTRDVLRYETTSAELNGAPVLLAHMVGRSGDAWSAVPILQIRDESIKGEPFPTGSSGPQSPLSGFGGRFSDALGETTAKPVREVAGVWLEFDFIAPSGQVETVRREVFDRIGLTARLRRQEASAELGRLALRNGVPLALTGLFSCSFTAGSLPTFLPFARLSQHAKVLRSVAPLLSSGRTPTEEEAQQLSGALSPTVPSILSSLAASVHTFSQQSRALLRTDDLLLYEATPRLAIVAVESTSPDGGKTVTNTMTVDLRRNELRLVSERLSGPQVVSANLARSVLDGAVEHILLGELTPTSGRRLASLSTVEVMNRADALGTDLIAVTTPEGIERVQASQTTKARMLGSLTRDVALVVPARALPFEGMDRLAWWQVNLKSGEALAVMEDGLHGQLVEYLATNLFVVTQNLFAFFFFGGIVNYIMLMLTILFVLQIEDYVKGR
jgi:transglutaminase-like putative cysteine protease